MEILLRQDELLDLGENLVGRSIICRVGSCWLTQAGDNRDHILRSGDRFNIRARGLLLITATENCRLMLVAEEEAINADFPWQPLTCSH